MAKRLKRDKIDDNAKKPAKKDGDDVRQMIACGVLYPEDKEKLLELINQASANVKNEKVNKPIGIIAPYGDYKFAINAYSHAYSQAEGEKYDTIIILSPITRMAFPGIALTEKNFFISPLGKLKIDRESNVILNKFNKELIFYKDKYHQNESAIEMQLPFISAIFKNNTEILPVIIGESNTRITLNLANALNSLFEKTNKRYLVIAVTNLASGLKYEEVVEYDNKFVDILLEYNPDHLSSSLAMREIIAHGGAGVITLQRLGLLMKKINIRVLRLFNSSEVNGDRYKSEGYISAVVW